MLNHTMKKNGVEAVDVGQTTLTASRLLSGAVVVRNAAKTTLGCGCPWQADSQAVYK